MEAENSPILVIGLNNNPFSSRLLKNFLKNNMKFFFLTIFLFVIWLGILPNKSLF